MKLATFGTLNLTRQSLAVGLLNSTLPSADARGLPSIGKFLERLFLANPSTLTKSEISCAALCTPAANADAPSVTPFLIVLPNLAISKSDIWRTPLRYLVDFIKYVVYNRV